MAALLSSTCCDILDHVVVIFANRPPQLVLTFQNTHTHTHTLTQGDRHKPGIVTCHDLGFNRKMHHATIVIGNLYVVDIQYHNDPL